MIDFSQRIDVKIPGSSATKDWCKELTAVDANATSGRDYEGEWVSVGSTADLPIGALLVHVDYVEHRRRGRELNRARLGLVLPNGLLWWIHVSTSEKGWAQELRRPAREWMALTPAERIRR